MEEKDLIELYEKEKKSRGFYFGLHMGFSKITLKDTDPSIANPLSDELKNFYDFFNKYWKAVEYGVPKKENELEKVKELREELEKEAGKSIERLIDFAVDNEEKILK